MGAKSGLATHRPQPLPVGFLALGCYPAHSCCCVWCVVLTRASQFAHDIIRNAALLAAQHSVAVCALQRCTREERLPATGAWVVRVCVGRCCWLVAQERQAPITVENRREGASVGLASQPALLSKHRTLEYSCALRSPPVCVAAGTIGQNAKGAFAPVVQHTTQTRPGPCMALGS